MKILNKRGDYLITECTITSSANSNISGVYKKEYKESCCASASVQANDRLRCSLPLNYEACKFRIACVKSVPKKSIENHYEGKFDKSHGIMIGVAVLCMEAAEEDGKTLVNLLKKSRATKPLSPSEQMDYDLSIAKRRKANVTFSNMEEDLLLENQLIAYIKHLANNKECMPLFEF